MPEHGVIDGKHALQYILVSDVLVLEFLVKHLVSPSLYSKDDEQVAFRRNHVVLSSTIYS